MDLNVLIHDFSSVLIIFPFSLIHPIITYLVRTTFRCLCCRPWWCGSVSPCLAHYWHTGWCHPCRGGDWWLLHFATGIHSLSLRWSGWGDPGLCRTAAGRNIYRASGLYMNKTLLRHGNKSPWVQFEAQVIRELEMSHRSKGKLTLTRHLFWSTVFVSLMVVSSCVAVRHMTYCHYFSYPVSMPHCLQDIMSLWGHPCVCLWVDLYRFIDLYSHGQNFIQRFAHWYHTCPLQWR